LAKKTGIGITIVILVAITAASFLVWSIPQNFETSFVVSDFEFHLDRIKEIHNTISEGVDNNYKQMLNGDISSEEYIKSAEIASTQINSQIIQLVESEAPEQWHESYLNYLESLKKTNTQIRETIVVANMITEEVEQDKIEEIMRTIDELKVDSIHYLAASDDARP